MRREQAMRVGRVLEACLYVDDLEAAEAFYHGVLGLEVHSRKEGRHVFFRCGEGVFLLFNPGQSEKTGGGVPAHGARGPGHVAFAVESTEVPAWREQLEAHGVNLEAEVVWPGGGLSLYLRDPDGNSIELATPQTWGLPSTDA